MSANAWYARQQKMDEQARSKSEALLGPEKDVFANVMGLVARCLDEVASAGAFNDLPTGRKVILASHGLNLLWSAWDEALAGRYDSAATHSRSIGEVPDFLDALRAEPAFADRMGTGTKDVNAARRIVRDSLETTWSGEGKRWLKNLLETDKRLQPLSHISVEVTQRGIAVGVGDEGKVGVLRPGGGVVSEWLLRPIAIGLAIQATVLFQAVFAAFQEIPSVDDIWKAEGPNVSREGIATLTAEVEALEPLKGDITLIHFLRSDEVPL